jgi:hypothetical protein
MGLAQLIKPNDWVSVRHAMQQIDRLLGPTSSPIFVGTTLTSLTLTGFSGVLKATAGVVGGSAVHANLGSIGANDHHNQVHVLNATDHTVSGLTAGHVLQALTDTTFGFAAIGAGSLPTHANSHASTGGDQVNHDTLLNVHQNVNTAASPTFAGIIIANGGTIGQSVGPLLTFDDTNNRLQLTGADLETGISVNGAGLRFQSTAEDGSHTNTSTRIFFSETGRGHALDPQYGFSFIYAGGTNPTLGGTVFTLAENIFYFRNHSGSATGTTIFSVGRDTGVMTITNAPIMSALTASNVVMTDANKGLISLAGVVTGSFTTVDLKTVTVTKGIITSIV